MPTVTDADVIRVLRLQLGTCPHCRSHPLVSEHTERCRAAKELIERLEENHRDCGSRDCQVAAGRDEG